MNSSGELRGRESKATFEPTSARRTRLNQPAIFTEYSAFLAQRVQDLENETKLFDTQLEDARAENSKLFQELQAELRLGYRDRLRETDSLERTGVRDSAPDDAEGFNSRGHRQDMRPSGAPSRYP
uniref:Uncharacterized protein n=1 Tax=Eutreptiella gymnastica TaxID=73025 RepID=A0A7S1HTM1_9EUGL|mmetsp:Transcript_104853/g.180806  ORF Transcript_104853/g.180806 Transcript_104853/m.180806 type:complete len:125 (+) Transcript_104853:2-376(+)